MFSLGSHHPRKTTYHGHHGHHGHHQAASSRVRAVHNVANGPNVNVVVDGKIALSDVSYKAISDYLKVPSGKHAVAITTTDGSKTLASLDADLVPKADYTIVAHGDVTNLSSVALLALQDDNTCPKRGKAHVRFVHAAAKVPAVDIWANMQTPVFQNVAYGSTGSPTYVPVDAGEITLAVAPAGSTEVVLGPIPLKLDQKKTYTVIATGLLEDEDSPLSALVSEDNSCATVHTFY